MPTQLYAGTFNDFADSMAAEMEAALTAVLVERGRPAVPAANREDIQVLFISIARGVINHMKKKEQAFAVNVDGTHPASGFPSIQVKPSP
jgi:hypothetical protein